RAPPQREVLVINEMISEVMLLTRAEVAKYGVVVRTELADGLPFIQGDRVQLQQVILNLIINAIEAMGGMSEGLRELLIKTAKADPDGVLVSICDSGPGSGLASPERL